MHRHPPGRAHELDVDVLFNPTSHKLATDLIDHRFAFALFDTPSKVMTRRNVRGHRLPDVRGLSVESRRRRDISVERDEAHLPLVSVSARCCPGHVARRSEQDRFLLIDIERAGAPPDEKAHRSLALAPREELLQRYVDTVLFRDVVERHGVTQVAALR